MCACTLSSFMNFKHCLSFIFQCTVNWSVWYIALDSFVVCVQIFVILLLGISCFKHAAFLATLAKVSANLSVETSQPIVRFFACGLHLMVPL